MDGAYRDDHNLDRMRGELTVTNKEVALLKQENALLKKENEKLQSRSVGLNISRAVIITIAVRAAIYTGNGWFIALAFLAL